MSQDIRFDGQTVIVTGAGGGLGKAYCLAFAARGANVVVNDLGVSFKGEGKDTSAADNLVNSIKQAGGKAVANYDSVENGQAIIDTAIKAFGGVHILINNAGILRDKSFKNIEDQDWDLIFKVHVTGAYKCTQAAWPHFRKQKYGRVINTASAAGLFGNFGQTNYSAAKLALVGFTETLAKEGAKYNIFANVIAPIAASRMTETAMPPDMLKQLKPEFIVPLVQFLTHTSNAEENGSIFEVGGGHIAKIRWERAKGLLLKPDSSMTAGSILSGWDNLVDFSEPEHPSGVANFPALLEEALQLQSAPKSEQLDFKDKVVLVTGGGAGLGRAYCLLFAKHGAKIVVNDLVNPDDVVNEIRKAGGEATPSKANVEDGEAVVKPAIDAYGRIDVLVNNAGILRDKAFNNMDDKLWDAVMNTHARGTYKVTKAAWPYFLKQKYGRIINTTSTSGIYGNFGQANYAAAKLAILGFSRALAREGAKYNINVNTIAPNAGTAMTRTIMPEEMVQAFKPDYVAPLVVLLASDACPEPTGGLYEVGCGWQAQTRWQRSGGAAFPVDVDLTAETVAKAWEKIVDFEDGRADNPADASDGLQSIMANADNKSGGKSEEEESPADAELAEDDYNGKIAAAKKMDSEGTKYDYTQKDVMLYNLGIGAKRSDLQYIYEGHEDFQPVPTFGVIPPFNAVAPFSLGDIVPNFNPMMLLHGEQYLEVLQYPIPTEGNLVAHTKLVDVIDKGNAAIAYTGTSVKDVHTGQDVFYVEMGVFLRGAGGFDGPKQVYDRGRATKSYPAPKREPDSVVEEKTSEEQAAIYRLCADYNPLHVDPGFAKVAGFKLPPLHGLCTFGISGKHIVSKYGNFKNIKVRFASPVIPGQTLRTEMWKEGNTVIFQTKVKETDKLCIAAAGVELVGESAKL